MYVLLTFKFGEDELRSPLTDPGILGTEHDWERGGHFGDVRDG
jgi:hypothetical protein